ncbi:GumC family protein [Sedimentimonas flavescens]|uniref:GumC family protein n=1 Tax=Sedimentimonas flavescens TaxID=2851012 RepID=UPI0021A4FDAC|nr:GNVR domain-containing protein [Sedimentimonas flavescens]MCT2538454.1 Wzz/FepE/Etk N-terminal domain-containing protein [Sedimentimonas flavescens]
MAGSRSELIELRALVDLFLGQVRLIAGVTALIFGLGVGYLLLATPIYRATALVMVEPGQRSLLDGAEARGDSASDYARLESEVAILHSDKVLLATIREAGLMSDPEFGPRLSLIAKLRLALGVRGQGVDDPVALTAQTLERFAKAVSGKRRGQTLILEVSAESQQAEKAAWLANTLSQTYIALQLDAKVARALGARDLLQAQLDRAQQALAGSEAAIDAYLQREIAEIATETGNMALMDLADRLAASEAQRATHELAYQRADTATSVQDWAQLSAQLGDEGVASLAAQRAAVQARLEAAPDADQGSVVLRQELAALDRQLAQQGASAVTDLQTQVARLAAQSRDLREELRREVLRSGLSPETLSAIYGLQQDAEIAQRQYAALLARMRDLEAQAVVQVADSRIVSEALTPQDPVAPNVPLVLAAALILGFGMGLAAALARSYFVAGIDSSQQLAEVLPVPLAATIPWVDLGSGQRSVADMVLDAPFSAYTEAFRRLRLSLEQVPHRRSGAMVILVCSAVPGEGKSAVALALARSYALGGKRTLLIDADLRRPTLARHMGLTPELGLLDYIENAQALTGGEELCRKDPRSPVVAILGQGRPEQPTDQLLRSEIFDEVLETAREAFDVIVMDTAPLLPVVDTQYLAGHADAAIMAVRHAATAQAETREALRQLTEAGDGALPVLSVLSMDRSNRRLSRYRGYYAEYAPG